MRRGSRACSGWRARPQAGCRGARARAPPAPRESSADRRRRARQRFPRLPASTGPRARRRAPRPPIAPPREIAPGWHGPTTDPRAGRTGRSQTRGARPLSPPRRGKSGSDSRSSWQRAGRAYSTQLPSSTPNSQLPTPNHNHAITNHECFRWLRAAAASARRSSTRARSPWARRWCGARRKVAAGAPPAHARAQQSRRTSRRAWRGMCAPTSAMMSACRASTRASR